MRFIGAVRYAQIQEIFRPVCPDPPRLDCTATLIKLLRLFLHFYFTGFLDTKNRVFKELIDPDREEYDGALSEIEATFNHVLLLRDPLCDAVYSTIPGDLECSIYVERGESVMYDEPSFALPISKSPFISGDTKTIRLVFSAEDRVLWDTLRGFESQGILPESFLDSLLARRLRRPKTNRLRDIRSRRFLELDDRESLETYLENSIIEIEDRCENLLMLVETEIHRARKELLGVTFDDWNFTCLDLRANSSSCLVLTIVVHGL